MTTTAVHEGRAIRVGTSTARVKIEADATGGRFALIEWTLPQGAPAPPPHVHEEGSETFFVLEGEVVFPLADGPLRAPAGTCLHVPAGTVHTLSNPNPETARVLELFCPGSLLALVEGVGRAFAASPAPDRDSLAELFATHHSHLAGARA